MKAILTEKPSVAGNIARIVNAKVKKDGYYTGNGYMVTWALGHLTALALPEQYRRERLTADDLPLIPEPFRLTVRQCRSDRGLIPDPAAVKQLKVIQSVFDECDSIIVATDAGREGELIFRCIYSFLNCKKPFVRLWISSMTDEAIKKGLAEMKDGQLYEGLYQSGKCRMKADWLVGMNASQALALSSGMGNNSLGRVQTPTLAMICKRFLENRDFIPQDYWKIHITLQNGQQYRRFGYAGEIKTKEDAELLHCRIKDIPQATVKKAERKKVFQNPPLLFDLTALQKECNVRFDFSAGTTLDAAQSLYEKKLITYPRTGSRYIPDDVMVQIPTLLAKITALPDFTGCNGILDMDNLPRFPVNGSKVTDHHALLTTGIKAAGLTGNERAVYLTIAGRMLEAFAPPCEMESLSMEADAEGLPFRSASKKVTFPGWRAVLNRMEDKDEGEEPQDEGKAEFKTGEAADISGCSLSKGKTSAKTLYTEATLLTAMETAGKDIADEQAREAMKECGLGTPSTRAAIITTLFRRGYIERSGKKLMPTEKGLVIYNAVKDMMIADPELTGSWEKSLSLIENGDSIPETFMQAIAIYTRQVTQQALSVKFPEQDKPAIECPKCRTGKIKVNGKVAKCLNNDCGFIIFRKFLNKFLSVQDIIDICTGGKTALIKGFMGKKGKPFPAALKLDENYNLTFIFPDDENSQ